MEELTSLKNIGKEMEKKLSSIGICTVIQLKELDSKDVYLKLKIKYPEICLVHLYTIEGAINDLEYNNLSEEMKKELKQFVDSISIV